MQNTFRTVLPLSIITSKTCNSTYTRTFRTVLPLSIITYRNVKDDDLRLSVLYYH